MVNSFLELKQLLMLDSVQEPFLYSRRLLGCVRVGVRQGRAALNGREAVTVG